MTAGEALFALICLIAATVAFVAAVMYRRRGDLVSWAMVLVVSLAFGATAWLAVTS